MTGYFIFHVENIKLLSSHAIEQLPVKCTRVGGGVHLLDWLDRLNDCKLIELIGWLVGWFWCIEWLLSRLCMDGLHVTTPLEKWGRFYTPECVSELNKPPTEQGGLLVGLWLSRVFLGYFWVVYFHWRGVLPLGALPHFLYNKWYDRHEEPMFAYRGFVWCSP